MFNRIVVLFMGVAVAVLAIWAGSDLSVASIGGWTEHSPQAGYAVGALFSGAAALIAGGISACYCFGKIFAHDAFADAGDAFSPALLLICAAYLFGEFAQTTLSLSNWHTPWLFLLVIGGLPTIVAAKDVVVDP